MLDNQNKNMIDEEKKLTIPIINLWYVVVTLIFILLKYLGMIDWPIIWILSPLWIPITIAISISIIIYFLKFIIFLIDTFVYK